MACLWKPLSVQWAQLHSCISFLVSLKLHNSDTFCTCNLATLWTHVAALWLHILVTHFQLFCKPTYDTLTTHLQDIEYTFVKPGHVLLAIEDPKGNMDLWHVYQKIHSAHSSPCSLQYPLGEGPKGNIHLWHVHWNIHFIEVQIEPCSKRLHDCGEGTTVGWNVLVAS